MHDLYDLTWPLVIQGRTEVAASSEAGKSSHEVIDAIFKRRSDDSISNTAVSESPAVIDDIFKRSIEDADASLNTEAPEKIDAIF